MQTGRLFQGGNEYPHASPSFRISERLCAFSPLFSQSQLTESGATPDFTRPGPAADSMMLDFRATAATSFRRWSARSIRFRPGIAAIFDSGDSIHARHAGKTPIPKETSLS